MKTPILDEFISELEEFNEQGILTKELEDRLIEFKKIKEAIAVTHCCKSDSEQLPLKCVDNMPDSKYCDSVDECEWCKGLKR